MVPTFPLTDTGGTVLSMAFTAAFPVFFWKVISRGVFLRVFDLTGSLYWILFTTGDFAGGLDNRNGSGGGMAVIWKLD